MASKDAIQVIEPATAEVMAEIPRAGADETNAAIARAKQAFPAWGAMDPAARSALLHDLADAIAGRQEDLAKLEARNAGKPIGDARGEMGMVIETFRYYAGAPERLTGKTIPVAGGVDMTFREPLGVVGLITPWNFPLTIASWKVAPALAAGNTIVLKPAELTPLTAVELEKIALEAGLPEGVLNVVPGKGSIAGQRMVEHPDVSKVAFTGSTEVGRGIAEAAAATIKRVTLELGGKSANVIFGDSDLEAAASSAPLAVFGNAGQDCCARSRILVERGAMDDLKDELGDLLLQVVYHARMAEEEGAFAFPDVAEAISTKMIRRHPHVFGDGPGDGGAHQWEAIKKQEREAKEAENGPAPARSSLFGDIPAGLPSLAKSQKLQRRAARMGFDWPSVEPILSKVDEELAELRAEIESAPAPGQDQRQFEEFGDLLFVMVNLGLRLGIDAEAALRAANTKFTRRMDSMAAQARENGHVLESMTLDEMNVLWDRVKDGEKSKERG